MTRSQRRILIDTSLVGMVLTMLVVFLEVNHLLLPAEHYFYDLRARRCQFFTPPPTSKLVHIDIDDISLEAIGQWPWSRDTMAEIVDEIRLAGAKAMAMDIIYSEPQPPRYMELVAPPATSPTTAPAGPTTAPATVTARKVDADQALAAALGRFAGAVVPVGLNLSGQESPSPTYLAIVGELTNDLELDREQVTARLRQAGLNEADLAKEVDAAFLNARREAMFERLAREVKGEETVAELRSRILPKTDPLIGGSSLLRILDSEYARFRAVRAMRRFARPMSADMPALITTRDELAALRIFTDASASTGFVDYLPLSDGVVRTVPLWANHRSSFAFAQMDLALACVMLDVKLADVRITPNRVIIPKPDGSQIKIPVHDQTTGRGRFSAFMDIPWFGSNDWLTMYDFPEHKKPRQHMSIRYIWEACNLRHHIAENNVNIDGALICLLDQVDRAKAEQLDEHPLESSDVVSRLKLAEYTLSKFKKDDVDFWASMNPAELPAEDRLKREKILSSAKSLPLLAEQNTGLQANLAARRQALRDQLQGRAAMIGWIAMAAVADFVPTSLHPHCPGVVVHGAIFNAIMNDHFWYATGRWITIAITIAVGLVTTSIVVRLATWKALAAAAGLALFYLLFNGLYLFDYRHLLIGVAGPLLAISTVWAGCTLARYMLEANDALRSNGEFRNYVDPQLIDYFMEDENASVDGQEREMTVVFTDLQGFTTIAERLKEKSIGLLNEYMGLMVPLIPKHNGYRNKFLGDGIMFFFNAPRNNPAHARDAVRCAMEMQEVTIPFNASLAQRGLPAVICRAGLCAGDMVVGDAGAINLLEKQSDYTVLGDNVNLGARLESANKAFGTRILVDGRCRELVGDQVLFRPIGKIQVKGKLEGVPAFEALALMEKATREQHGYAQLTTEMVEEFAAGRFAQCLAAAERLEREFPSSKLTELYRALCQQCLQHPPKDFDGQIVLSEK